MCRKYLDEIAQKLRCGCASVIVGAGFSMNADSDIPGKTMPSWVGLGDILANEIKERSEFVLEALPSETIDLADIVENKFGHQCMDQIVKDNIKDYNFHPGEIHRKLLRLPWNDIFTTNYDTLLERANILVPGRKYRTIYEKADLVNSAGVPRIVKLHGSVDKDIPLVLSSRDYETYPIKNAVFVNTVRQALIENVLCLIGFSGKDPNFQNWIEWIRDNLGEANLPKIYFFALSNTENSLKSLFEKHNIVVVDLSEVVGAQGINSKKDVLIFALDYLEQKLAIKKKLITDDPFDTNANLDVYKKITELSIKLKDWILVPDKIDLMNFNWLLIKAQKKVCDIVDKDKLMEDDLNFINDFLIVARKSLWLITPGFAKILPSILKKLPIKTKISSLIALNSLSILRQYFELEYWDKCYKLVALHYGELSDYDRDMAFNEECLFWLYNLDFNHFKDALEKWDKIISEAYWQIRKADLWVVIGNLDKAYNMVSKELSALIDKNVLEPGNRPSLLLESIALNVHNRIAKAKKYNEDLKNGYRYRVLEYDKYDINWERINNDLLRDLVYGEDEPQTYKESYGFDLTNNISFSLGQNEYFNKGFSYIKFRELTAAGYKYGIWFEWEKSSVEAVSRMFKLSPLAGIALCMIMDSNKGISKNITRNFIGDLLDYSLANHIAEMYLKALESNKDFKFCEMSSYLTKRLKVNLAGVASRFFCRCTNTIVPKALETSYLLDDNEKSTAVYLERLFELNVDTRDSEKLKERIKKYEENNNTILYGEQLDIPSNKDALLGYIKNVHINNSQQRSSVFEALFQMVKYEDLSVRDINVLIENISKCLGNPDLFFLNDYNDYGYLAAKIVLMATCKRNDWAGQEDSFEVAKSFLDGIMTNRITYHGLIECWRKLIGYRIDNYDFNTHFMAVIQNPDTVTANYNLNFIIDEIIDNRVLTNEQLESAFNQVVNFASVRSYEYLSKGLEIIEWAVIFKPEWINKLTKILHDILFTIRYTTSNNNYRWEKHAEECLLIRREAVELCLLLKYRNGTVVIDDVLQAEISEWEKINQDLNEFVEIRNANIEWAMKYM